VPGYVEEELRGYLECGILCFGFARALCTGCGQAFVVAFSCKGRGVCPSCNGRHMAQTAADMLAWVNSGFSVDASVRITLIDRDVFQGRIDELPVIDIHSL
jgi:hypothetical protein